jgi:hypothetical protein
MSCSFRPVKGRSVVPAAAVVVAIAAAAAAALRRARLRFPPLPYLTKKRRNRAKEVYTDEKSKE